LQKKGGRPNSLSLGEGEHVKRNRRQKGRKRDHNNKGRGKKEIGGPKRFCPKGRALGKNRWGGGRCFTRHAGRAQRKEKCGTWENSLNSWGFRTGPYGRVIEKGSGEMVKVVESVEKKIEKKAKGAPPNACPIGRIQDFLDED